MFGRLSLSQMVLYHRFHCMANQRYMYHNMAKTTLLAVATKFKVVRQMWLHYSGRGMCPLPCFVWIGSLECLKNTLLRIVCGCTNRNLLSVNYSYMSDWCLEMHALSWPFGQPFNLIRFHVVFWYSYSCESSSHTRAIIMAIMWSFTLCS